MADSSESLHEVITVDCSNPREIDDGLHVQLLDDEKEKYRVTVHIADTASLYDRPEVREGALKKKESRYWKDENGKQQYDPMIDKQHVRQRELRAGGTKNTLAVSFIVGDGHPPSDVDIRFSPARIARNLTYRQFDILCQADPKIRQIARASGYIIQHLDFISGGDSEYTPASFITANDLLGDFTYVPRRMRWKRGSRVNEALMVATNALVGGQLYAEGWPAAFRVHDPSDESHRELIPPSMARFSVAGGPHTGMGLQNVCWVTSPLRRLGDFTMNQKLRQRDKGYAPTAQDAQEVGVTILALNRHILLNAPEPSRLSRREVLGKGKWQLGSVATQGAQVIPLHIARDEEAAVNS